MSTVKFKDYSKEERLEMVKKGWALPDPDSGGAFPIANKDDLENALHRIGTTKHARASVIAHIRKRAKALGATDMLGEKTAPKASHGATVQAGFDMQAAFSQRKVTPEGMVLRRGKVYEADKNGAPRIDMHGIPFATTRQDLIDMVMNFEPFDPLTGKPTIPIGLGHPEATSPLDGHLGHVTTLYLGATPDDLDAEVAIPVFVDDVLGDNVAKPSMVFELESKSPVGLDFVNDPNVVDAALAVSFAKHQATTTPATTAPSATSTSPAPAAMATTQSGVSASAETATEDKPKRNKAQKRFWENFFFGQFKAAEKLDKALFAGDDPANDFEADWQEEHMTGASKIGGDSAPGVGNLYDPAWSDFNKDGQCPKCGGNLDGSSKCPTCGNSLDANPTPIAAGTGGEVSANMSTDTVNETNQVRMAQLQARATQLEMDLQRERASRIESEANAWAEGEITAQRSLPAEKEVLVEMYRQAAADDSILGLVKMVDGTSASRTERLKVMFASRSEHWMTKEQMATALRPDVVAAAMATAHQYQMGTGSADGVRMTPEQRKVLLNHTNVGKQLIKQEAAGSRN